MRLTNIFEAVLAVIGTPVPRGTVHFYQPGMQLLAAACREIQRRAGDRTFPLDYAEVAAALAIGEDRAERWVNKLRYSRLLTRKGGKNPSGPNRYKYLGD